MARFPVDIKLGGLPSTNLHDIFKIAETLEDKVLDDICRQYESTPDTIDIIISVYAPLMGILSSLRDDNEILIFRERKTERQGYLIRDFNLITHLKYSDPNEFTRYSRNP